MTTIDPRTALIVVDLQQGLLNRPTVHPLTEVIKQAAALADAFRRHALPVVLVTVLGGAPGRTEQQRATGPVPDGWAELVPELNQRPSDHLVAKRTWGAFTGTDLESYLKGLDVTQVVVAGVSTSAGVESTARQAYELGFNVTLATDAMTDTNADAHLNSLTRVFPRLGERATTEAVITLLDRP